LSLHYNGWCFESQLRPYCGIKEQMNVLMLSGDPKLSDPKSSVSKRLASYSPISERIFIVVTAVGKSYQLADNIFVFPVGRGIPVLRIGTIVKKAEEIIKSEKLTAKNTIITVQDPFDLGSAGVRLKNKFSVKLEVQVHGDIQSIWFKKQSHLHSWRVKNAPKVFAVADKIRAVSNQVAESLATIVPRHKIYVLPISVSRNVENGNRNFLPQKFPGLGLIMLTVARLEKEKNVEQSIRLLKKIITLEPHAGLVIVGDGSLRKKLESLATKLGVRELVSFEGWQDNTADYFASCHLYLQTSFFEGYGMAIAEAALSGKAVLASDVGVAHDLAKFGGALVAPVNDDQKLFEQAKILLNQERRVIMGLAGERLVSSLIVSPEKYLQIQSEEWQKLLQ